LIDEVVDERSKMRGKEQQQLFDVCLAVAEAFYSLPLLLSIWPGLAGAGGQKQFPRKTQK
jgi:hypothetical protein